MLLSTLRFPFSNVSLYLRCLIPASYHTLPTFHFFPSTSYRASLSVSPPLSLTAIMHSTTHFQSCTQFTFAPSSLPAIMHSLALSSPSSFPDHQLSCITQIRLPSSQHPFFLPSTAIISYHPLPISLLSPSPSHNYNALYSSNSLLSRPFPSTSNMHSIA